MSPHDPTQARLASLVLSKAELGAQVDSAYDLLRYATENSAQLPNDVLVAITDASESLRSGSGMKNAEEETRFWNAYSLLFSNKLADQARRKYRLWLYVVLTLLLVGQIYYVAGSLVVNRLTEVEDEWQGNAATASAVASATEPAQGMPPSPSTTLSPLQDQQSHLAMWQTLRRFGTSQANYYLGIKLLPFFTQITVPETLIPKGMPSDKAHFMVNYMKLRAELELILLSLSGYILPLLYGTLGAFAYVLRKLCDPVTKLNFANDTWSTYTFRIHIGSLGGLAVGWFINGNAPASGIGALSPLALAFAAGYGSDLLFTLLDKVVGAFSSAPGLQSSVKSETTQRGGMTITTETQRQATVSGTAPPEAIPKDDSKDVSKTEPAGQAQPPATLRAAE